MCRDMSGVDRSCQEVSEGVRRHQGLSGVARKYLELSEVDRSLQYPLETPGNCF